MILMLVADHHAPLLVMLLVTVALCALGANRLLCALDVNFSSESLQTDEFWIGLVCLALALAVVI